MEVLGGIEGWDQMMKFCFWIRIWNTFWWLLLGRRFSELSSLWQGWELGKTSKALGASISEWFAQWLWQWGLLNFHALGSLLNPTLLLTLLSDCTLIKYFYFYCRVNKSMYKRVYNGKSLPPSPSFSLPTQRQPMWPGSFVPCQLVFQKGLCRDFHEVPPSLIPSTLGIEFPPCAESTQPRGKFVAGKEMEQKQGGVPVSQAEGSASLSPPSHGHILVLQTGSTVSTARTLWDSFFFCV